MNFTNVSRLAGGIVAYDRTINAKGNKTESLFKGTNYVFDGRVGREITDDKLGDCITCGTKTNLLTNCRNVNCHKRMVQCENCRDSFLGTCSDACKQRVVTAEENLKKGMPSLRGSETKEKDNVSKPALRNVEDYADFYSSHSAPLFAEIQKNTEHFFPTGAHMVSGPMQGQFLKTLASLSKNGNILEVGTFTGYATTCFWNGVENRDDGGYVLSLERDARAIEVAVKHLQLMENYGVGIEAAGMAKQMRESDIDNSNSECALNYVRRDLEFSAFSHILIPLVYFSCLFVGNKI